MQVQSLGREDSLEKEDSCLENPMDRAAWWIQSIGVAKIWA